MSINITDVIVRDIRFPTSETNAGTDAVHTDCNYSATYVVLTTDSPDGLTGEALSFTIGRGNEVCVVAVKAVAQLIMNKSLDSFFNDMSAFSRMLTNDSQLRWLGPEKGVIHLASSAVINAVWDIYAKIKKVPLWKLLVDMTPEELVACIDFRYISDVITPQVALEIFQEGFDKRKEREAIVCAQGVPAYTTSVGWLGYSDDDIKALCREAKDMGWSSFKIKVGKNIDEDEKRLRMIRQEIGPDSKMMLDANQVWDVDEAIKNMQRFAQFDPWWIEEPTSPDDILGHAKIAQAIHPIQVATGEHCQNRVVFKQFFQAKAISFCQIDCCRLGGVNEILAVLLMAKKFNIPVCPHAGGVGLCEYVQHLAIFDYVALTGSFENRLLEYVDHLHEHFEHPVVIKNGHYMVPTTPGFSITMKSKSLDEYEFPMGEKWVEKRFY